MLPSVVSEVGARDVSVAAGGGGIDVSRWNALRSAAQAGDVVGRLLE